MENATPTKSGINWGAVGAIGGIIGLILTVITIYLSTRSSAIEVSASAAGGPTVGWVVTASGDGFEAGERVESTIGGNLFGSTDTTASEFGHVFVTGTVPSSWTPGDYVVVLKGLSSQRSGSATVRLAP